MKNICSRTGRNALVMIAAAAVFLQPGCRSAQAIPGQRLSLTDTQREDFSRQITSHLFENGMMVGVGNDDRCLYIFFTPDIRHRQRPPSRVQLTLWLDENGGRAKRLGLVHVSGPTGQRPQRRGDAPEMNKEPPPGPAASGTAPELLKIINNGQGKDFFASTDGSQGPVVRLAADWGDFAYQLRIPFQGAGDWPGLKGDPGRVIGIGMLWQIESLAGPGKNDGEHPRGGPGMGLPPGMEGNGPPPGRGMGAESIPNKRSLWLKTTLVAK
ncbi:MAG TPA: hypothetical protein VF451_01710 [Acidobacteriota bacterium]